MDMSNYYVPSESKWPIIGATAVFLLVFSLAMAIFEAKTGVSWFTKVLSLISIGLMMYMLFGWFSNVIHEDQKGLYSNQLNRSFRISMGWFIVSEVMFFAAFFGALFYARILSVPWLGGEGDKGTSAMLWEGFQAQWPLLENPNSERYPSPSGIIDAWKLPFLNTAMLVTSSVTLTIAHHALKQENRLLCKKWLLATLVLGVVFLFVQGYEYIHAYRDLNLKLDTGIYASTFFMLTGFHGAHVTIGSILLATMLIRIVKGHFSAQEHFGFEAAAWYWHFVDVVWLLLFIFVYVL